MGPDIHPGLNHPGEHCTLDDALKPNGKCLITLQRIIAS